jgi:hypothetical protein
METKLIKIEKLNGTDSKVLNIEFNENDQAIVGNHTPEESEKIIKDFIESKSEPARKCDAIAISNNNDEPAYGESNWKGQKFILDNGILKVQNDIDPVIDIKAGSLLIYDGYTVGLTKRQYENIKNAQAKDTTIAFNDCMFNDDIVVGNVHVEVDNGAFETLIFEDNIDEVDEIIENRTTMNITNGTRIDSLIIGGANHVNVNCDVCSGDENAVAIGRFVVKGTASLYNCHVDHLIVDKTATAEVGGEVENICVSGTAFITDVASVSSIHIHAGGKICGENLDGIDITCDRAFRTYIENNKTWIIG